MYIKLFLSFIFYSMVFNHFIFGQYKELDSLWEIYNNTKVDTIKIKLLNEQIGLFYRSINPDSALICYQNALMMAEKADPSNTNNTCLYLKSNSLRYIGIIFYLKGNYDNANEYYYNSLKIKEKIGDKLGMARCYNCIGAVHWSQGDFDMAINYYYDGLELYKEINDKIGISSCYNNIGVIYRNQGKYEEAVESYFNALKIYTEINDKSGISAGYMNIGLVYKNKGDYNTAIHYYQKSLKLDMELNDRTGMATVYNNLSSIYYAAYDSVDNKKIKLKNNKLDSAIFFAKKAYNLSIDIGSVPMQNNAAQNLQNAYTKHGKYKEAIKYAEIYIATKDSMFSEEKIKALAEMESKYENEKNQLMIEKMEKEKELDRKTIQNQEIENRKQQIIAFSSIGGFILILIFLIILIRTNRNIKKINILLQDKNNEIIQQKEEISLQKEILEEMNTELEKLSVVASKTENAVLLADNYGKIEWINEGFTRLFGYTFEDLKDKNLDTINKLSRNKEIEQTINYCIETGKSVNYESLNFSKSGEEIWAQTTITPIKDIEGNITKLIVIDSDIRKLKMAEKEIIQQKDEIKAQRDLVNEQNIELQKHRNHLEQLVNERTAELLIAKEKAEESDRLKSAFFANMSHEVRTPMNAIIGFSNILMTKGIDDAKRQELLEHVISNTDSLLHLIDDIIDVAKIESGQFNLYKEDFSVNNLYDELIEDFKEKYYSKTEIKLIYSKNPKDVIVYTDKFRIRQILNNNIENAYKFTEKGSIETGFKVKDDNILFYVKDTGIGMTKDQQNIIFKRFTKLENEREKLYRGAGLGLYLCKSIIELLEGKIWVESEVKKGSTFYFSLPSNIFRS